MTVSASSLSNSQGVPQLNATNTHAKTHLVRPETVKQMSEEVATGKIDLLKRVATAFSNLDFNDGVAHPQSYYQMMQLMATAIKKNIFPTELAKTVTCNFLKYNIFAGADLPEDVVVKCKNGEVTFNKTLLQILSPYFRNHFANSKEEEKSTVDNFSKEFNKETLQLLKRHYYFRNFFVREDTPLDTLEELTTLAKRVEEPSLVEKCRIKAQSTICEKQLKEFLETLPREQILEETQYIQRLFAIEEFLRTTKHPFKKTEGGLLLEIGSAFTFLEASESSPYPPEFFQGIFCSDKNRLHNVLLSDLSLSIKSRNLVKELRLEVAPETDELLKILELFPKVEKVSVPFIGQHTQSSFYNNMQSIVNYCDTTELCKILTATKEHATLKQIHFLRPDFSKTEPGKHFLKNGVLDPHNTVMPCDAGIFNNKPNYFELKLTHELITTFGNAKVTLSFDDSLEFYFMTKDTWFETSYQKDKDFVAGLLSTSIPIGQNYKLKNATSGNVSTLFEFERK